MHQVNEAVEVAHVHQLKAIYARILADYFGAPLV
jgi:succinyl-diaminopimelate desuccinylase